VTTSAAELLAPRLEQRIVPGLDRVQRALAAYGNPHERFASVLVVGTNGKGATAAMLASLLHAHGVRVGLYTSPHLVGVEERIAVGGQPIRPADLSRLVAELDRFPELSYFETLTVAALWYFASTGAEVAVLEAGLGGRWDAVNAVHPVVSLLTNVGTDHRAWLGPTRTHIAAEKAAALRGREAIIGTWDGEVEATIRQVATAGRLSCATDWVDVEEVEGQRGGQKRPGNASRLVGAPPSGAPPFPAPVVRARADGIDAIATLPLVGRHQLDNLRLAVAGAAALGRCGVAPPLEHRALVRGVESVRWPGRLQWVEHGGRHLLLDGAHNREAVLALAAALDETNLAGRVDLLFSCLRDKPLAEMAAILAPRADRVTVVTLDSPRAAPTGELAAAFPGASVATGVATALAACRLSSATLVTGSLYLVGEVLRLTGGMDG